MNSERPRQVEFWAYAGSFGALWGALEATLGSFLHALKIPFAGVFLASMGAALLIALRRLVPRPGILLATGAVCAAVKLASPATDLLGPVVGILIESALIELCTLPLGANLGSALCGGALAASWAICQKVLKQIVLYGEPMVALYRELLLRASKMLGLSQAGGMRLVIGFVALMATFGALAACAGLRAGRRAESGELEMLELAAPLSRSQVRAPREPVSRGQALLGAALSLLQLVVLAKSPKPWHSLSLSLLLTLALCFARPLLSRIGSLRSWLYAFAMLALLGALLGPKEGARLSLEGAALAITMIARAVGLVLLCQALLALLPPLRPESSPFARAVAAALDALPRLTQTMGIALRSRQARGVRSPLRLALGLLDDAVALASRSASDGASPEPPNRKAPSSSLGRKSSDDEGDPKAK